MSLGYFSLLPEDLIKEIIKGLDKPNLFFNLIRVSKEMNRLCNIFSSMKKEQFLRKVKNEREEYSVFPNKVFEGSYEKYNDSGELIEKGTYKYGKKDGLWEKWSYGWYLIYTKENYSNGVLKSSKPT